VKPGTLFRTIALSLPGTTESLHFDRQAFKVVRIYATLAADGDSANLRWTPEEQEFKCLLAPRLFETIPNGWGRQGWTTMLLTDAVEADMRAALEMAHAHALPAGRKKR
jgi:hypothetical protein